MRLPPVAGEWIDRQRPLTFRFEGAPYSGWVGDTISSALLASGVGALGRSFKYHRLRGVLSLANHDVNTMVQVGNQLNLRADVTALEQNMEVVAINTRGGLKNDRLAIMDKLSAFLPVGFYYKAFHTPKSWFPSWERTIRNMSGLGVVNFNAPRIHTPKRYDFCDVLVIGAGPSGLAAAIAAADAGANQVVVADENARAGGSLTYQRGAAADVEQALADLLSQIEQRANIQLRLATEAAGHFDDHWIPLVDRDKIANMRAGAVVVATGVFEQPAVFRHNDLPGIMLASAAQRLIYRYGVRPFEQVVLLTANSEGYRAALDFLAHGIRIAALVDLRSSADISEFAAELAAADIEILKGYCIYEAVASAGKQGVAAAIVCPLSPDGEPQLAARQTISCDAIVMSVGFAPALNLLHQAGMKASYDSTLGQFVPAQLPPGVSAAGRANGVYSLHSKLRDGERAGLEAARHLGLAATVSVLPVAREVRSPNHPFPIVEHPKGKNFVDFDEDIQLKDFRNAAQEGFDNIELLKRYTTVGMGPSQGKHSNMNAIRILAKITGKPVEEIGSTTARPFFHPVPLSHLAGRSLYPERLTPLHSRHAAFNARFMQAGVWLRPEFYLTPGKSKEEAVREEVRAVRQSLGVIDIGTLGKLEVYGADAAQFLERVYTGRFANMKVGATRYALMCDESGVMIDDGVVARFAEQHFYLTTTTTGSAGIYRELTRLNTQWRLDVGIVNATGHFAALNLAGPHSRAVLQALADFDLSEHAFPYLGAREGLVAGIPSRLMRVGFVGESGYEIHVPAEYAPALWDILLQRGAAFAIRPFGVEAQRLLRLEKGHVIVGQDSDGLTTPFEAASGFAVKMDKPFFVGQRSLRIIQAKPMRHTLVAFAMDKSHTGPLPKECHLVIDNGAIAGRVTSVAMSETLGHVLGLAYVHPGLATVGSKLSIRVEGGILVTASVVKPPFYDPEGARQKILPQQVPVQGIVDTPPPSARDQRPIRVSPLHSELEGLHPTWAMLNDMPVARRIGSRAEERQRLANVALADLSFRKRHGLKGAGAAAWLKTHGIEPPAAINQWAPFGDGGLIARLATSEFFLEDNGEHGFIARVQESLGSGVSGVTPVLRQDAGFLLCGPLTTELLLQTCSLNFATLDLASKPIVMTSVIGVSALLVPGALREEPFFRLWCDATFAVYLWKHLLQIAGELGGGAIGLAALGFMDE
jgi:sarcosine oxidase, subunit alpha